MTAIQDDFTLLRPFDIAVRVRRSPQTIIRWARRGWIPGAVFVGPHVMFDPRKVAEFIENGGSRPMLPEIEPAKPITLRHVAGKREHASRHGNGLTAAGGCKHNGRRPTTDAELVNPHRIVDAELDSRSWFPNLPELKA